MTAPKVTNRFRQTLTDQQRPLVGIWSMLNSTNVTEGLAHTGYDWLCIDCEHAPVDLSDMMSHLRVLDDSPTIPLVRLVWNDQLEIKRALDAGATTIMLPFVQTAEEAAAAVGEMHYPPRGTRGAAGMHRASRFGAVADYVHQASDSLFLIVQIETLEALENLDSILAVDGVDAVFFGPGDLSASMGRLGQAGGDEVTKLICDALPQAKASGKFVGTLAVNPDQARTFIDAGFDFVSVTNDCALLFSGARNYRTDLQR